MVELTPGTRKRLELLFAADDVDLVAGLLVDECGENLPFCDRAGRGPLIERIRFAVLKLSEGRLDKFDAALKLAQQDWRDVLVAAGFGDDVEAHFAWWPEAELGSSAGDPGLL